MASEMNLADQIREKIALLQESLLAQHPRIPALLQEIHANLRSSPDVCTLLDENEISVIVSGLERQANIKLADLAISKTKTSTKSLKGLTLDDL